MKTFAVVIPTAGYREFDGNNYATLPGGTIARVIHGPGFPFAQICICGAALKERAEQRASEIPDAIVLELESEYWPGDLEILRALEKHILETEAIGNQIPEDTVEKLMPIVHALR